MANFPCTKQCDSNARIAIMQRATAKTFCMRWENCHEFYRRKRTNKKPRSRWPLCLYTLSFLEDSAFFFITAVLTCVNLEIFWRRSAFLRIALKYARKHGHAFLQLAALRGGVLRHWLFDSRSSDLAVRR